MQLAARGSIRMGISMCCVDVVGAWMPNAISELKTKRFAVSNAGRARLWEQIFGDAVRFQVSVDMDYLLVHFPGGK